MLGAFGVDVDQPLSRRRLDHHDADRVADDVVQLTGDARPLVADCERGEQLPLLLELAGPQREFVGCLAAQPQDGAATNAGTVNMTAATMLSISARR